MTWVKWFIIRSIAVINHISFIGGFVKINGRVNSSYLGHFYGIAVRASRIGGSHYKVAVMVNISASYVVYAFVISNGRKSSRLIRSPMKSICDGRFITFPICFQFFKSRLCMIGKPGK